MRMGGRLLFESLIVRRPDLQVRRVAGSKDPASESLDVPAKLRKRHPVCAEVPRSEREKRPKPLVERVQLTLRLVVGTAADDDLAGVEEEVEDGRAAVHE